MCASSHLVPPWLAMGLFKVELRWVGEFGRAFLAATVLVTKSASFQPEGDGQDAGYGDDGTYLTSCTPPSAPGAATYWRELGWQTSPPCWNGQVSSWFSSFLLFCCSCIVTQLYYFTLRVLLLIYLYLYSSGSASSHNFTLNYNFQKLQRSGMFRNICLDVDLSASEVYIIHL